MKKTIGILGLCIIFLFLIYKPLFSYNICRAKYFNVVAPEGWVIESDGKFDGFAFFAPEYFDQTLYISIIAKEESSKELDKLWDLRKKLFFTKEERVIREKAILMNGKEWHTLLGEWKNVGKEMNKLVLFTVNNGVSYLVQFNSPKGKYDEFLPVLNKTLSSLRLEKTWYK